jgi:A/G-specific adenine glycosylase
MTAWCDRLLQWYHTAKREMPWRGHPDPYAVWVSEIMLQQTQVNTVRPYFERFLATFPTITALAAAPDETLLKAWEGLGYYTRVRNLRKAAQELVAHHQANLPKTAAALKQLPGIGAYTAAAIASICFDEPEPVVDGNVARVFARRNHLTEDFSKEPNRRQLANWLRPYIQAVNIPGDFNQAMMELGALICTPRTPQCDTCPLRRECKAAQTGTQSDYPTIPAKKALPKRERDVLLIQNDEGHILLARHSGERLLDGFWELPAREDFPLPYAPLKKKPCHTHHQTFTHFRQTLRVYTTRLIQSAHTLPENLLWTPIPSPHPLTTATRQILSKSTNRPHPHPKG